MKGYYKKRGSTWSFRLDIGKDRKTGKRRQKSKGGFRTKKEAEKACQLVINELNEGSYKEISNEQFDHYFTRWFESQHRREVAPSTYESRYYLIRKHLLPYFESKAINTITAFEIDCLYNDKLDKGYSPKTVKEMHCLLKKGFQQAVKWDLLIVNPVLNATPPRCSQTERSTWSRQEVKTFLESAEKQDKHIPYFIGIFTGMRRGEVLGLQWSDIDFQEGKIHIQRSLTRTKQGLLFGPTKTAKSKRQISISPYVIEKLLQFQKKQNGFKDAFGDAYHDHDLIVCTEDGKPKEPRNLLREYYQLIKEAHVPRISFHDLRHTHATLMLSIGENPKIVAERLGHSRVGITLDVYSHVNADMQDKAATKFEEAYFSKS